MSHQIGIYSGTFDPIHNGHIDFALQALQVANLDKVYFLAEPLPRHKPHVTDINMRRTMIDIAIKPYAKLEQLSLLERHFSIPITLPLLQNRLQQTSLTFLFGSDVFCNIPDWQSSTTLAGQSRFIVAIRDPSHESIVNEIVGKLNADAITLHSQNPKISSKKIRDSIYAGYSNSFVPQPVLIYIVSNHIYSPYKTKTL